MVVLPADQDIVCRLVARQDVHHPFDCLVVGRRAGRDDVFLPAGCRVVALVVPRRVAQYFVCRRGDNRGGGPDDVSGVLHLVDIFVVRPAEIFENLFVVLWSVSLPG